MAKRSIVLFTLVFLLVFSSCASFSPNYYGYSYESKNSLQYILDKYLPNSIYQEDIKALCKKNDYVVRYFEDLNHAEIFPRVKPLNFSPLGVMALMIYSPVEYKIEFYDYLIYGNTKEPRNFYRAEIECNDKIFEIKNISSEVDQKYDAENIKIVLSRETIDFLYENWDEGQAYITLFGKENIRKKLDSRCRGLLDLYMLLKLNQEISSW